MNVPENALEHENAGEQEAQDDNHNHQRNYAEKHEVRFHGVGTKLRPHEIEAPVFLIFVNAKILPQIRAKENRAVLYARLKMGIQKLKGFLIGKLKGTLV